MREQSNAVFDAHAADYESQCMRGLAVSGESKTYFARGRLDFLSAWWSRQGRPEPRRIVDYGCGIGDATAMLAETFPRARVLGLDPSRECISRANRYASDRVEFRTSMGDAAAARADLVHLNGVVHHVEPGERPRLFADLVRILAPDGVVALFENNPLNPGTHLVMARIPFDRGAVKVPPWEARRRLRAAGVRPVTTGYLFYFPRFLSALRPLERLLLHVPLGAQYGVLGIREATRPAGDSPA